MDEILLLKQQQQQRLQQLLKIGQRKADFYDPRSIPMDLEEQERHLQIEIENIEAKIQEMIAAADQYQEYLRSSNTVSLPIITVAMTHDEAIAITNGKLFAPDSEESKEFKSFCSTFEKFRAEFSRHYTTDWVSHYGKTRDDWKLHASPHVTVREAVEQIASLSNIKRQRQSHALPSVQTQFLSTQFFDKNDTNQRRKMWRELSRSGCILIVDPISLYHPYIWHSLLQSNLTGNKKVAMLILSPINFNAIPTHTVLEKEIDKRLEIVFERFTGELDYLCEFSSGDLRTLQRWMHTVLFDAEQITQNMQAPIDNLSMLANATGSDAKRYDQTEWPHLGRRER